MPVTYLHQHLHTPATHSQTAREHGCRGQIAARRLLVGLLSRWLGVVEFITDNMLMFCRPHRVLLLVSTALCAVCWLCICNEHVCICVNDASYLCLCAHAAASVPNTGLCVECNECLCVGSNHIVCNYECVSCPSSALPSREL